MGVKLIVAVTDRDWFEHLRGRSFPEVNFWAPSGTAFRALQPGELFLFKLHAPDNAIVGGGVFSHASNLPCSLAWQAFGEANGALTLAEMRRRIVRYRRQPDDGSDFAVGCRILTQPFFLPESDWLPVPPSWSPNIVTFKSYDSAEGDGAALWRFAESQVSVTPTHPVGMPEEQARFGAPTLIAPRLGQGAFRIVVTDSYRRRCAVTGERTLPALDAAHIRPFGSGGEHRPSNGLLLRKDIHSLFDAGYVTVTPDLRFNVSPRIREEFENGRVYYELHGRSIAVPDRDEWRPSAEALRWHSETQFRR